MNDRWERVTSLFDAARALQSAERGAFLTAACNGDPGLRSEVESLLDHDIADTFLARPASLALTTAVRQSAAIPEPGQLLCNRYRIEARMATGGQAIVYRALDQVLSRPVVIKVLRCESRQDRALESRLRREMEVLARIDHPGVVGILDMGGLPDGSPFLVVQHIEGESLREALREPPLDRQRVAAIARQTGSALSAAHALGIAHRDLKPENIMLQQLSDGAEAVKLIDFGIAKIDEAELDRFVTTVMVAGTVRYMAPEQFQGKNGPASDIYALALVVCEMLSGQPDLRALPAGVDGRVRRALAAALAFRPDDRPQQVRAWSDDLAAALTSHTRRDFAIAAGSAVALLGGAAIAASRWYAAREDTPRVIEYTAPFDPVTEGFQMHNDLAGTIVENPARTGYDAWRVTSPRQGDYFRHLKDRQKRAALESGWKLTAVMRGEMGNAFASVDFAGRGRRFDINILVNPDTELVRLNTQVVPDPEGLVYQIPRSRSGYRRYELVYDPGLASAVLSIDGKKVLRGYRGHSQFQEDWGVMFGACVYASPRGVGSFQLVRFEINP